jgi:hypothetical protein
LIEAKLIEDGIALIDKACVRFVVQHRQRLSGAGAPCELSPVEKFGHDPVLCGSSVAERNPLIQHRAAAGEKRPLWRSGANAVGNLCFGVGSRLSGGR